MPRLTEERRSANRAVIIDAARRCFSRNGFHETSMPDIAAEAGVSTGAPYRYFTGKEELVVEVATLAFAAVFDPLVDAAPSGMGDLVASAVEGHPAGPDDEELLRCGVSAWAELLRSPDLRAAAVAGFERVLDRVATTLASGQAAGTVSSEIDPRTGARVVVALLHGFMLQRTAFGLTDVDGFAHDVRAALAGTSLRPG